MKGLPAYHPHQLRHSFATHMDDRGAPLQVIAVLLDHAKLSTSQVYTRVSPGRVCDAYQKAHPHAKGAWELALIFAFGIAW